MTSIFTYVCTTENSTYCPLTEFRHVLMMHGPFRSSAQVLLLQPRWHYWCKKMIFQNKSKVTNYERGAHSTSRTTHLIWFQIKSALLRIEKPSRCTHSVWKLPQKVSIFQAKRDALISKTKKKHPLVALFCPLQILLNSCKFWVFTVLKESPTIKKNFQGAKTHHQSNRLLTTKRDLF